MRTEIPGGFSPEEAQELLDNLVRSHISKALSGERMAARDRYAELAWIRQQLVDAAWFVRATLEAHGTSVGNESPSALPETMPAGTGDADQTTGIFSESGETGQ